MNGALVLAVAVTLCATVGWWVCWGRPALRTARDRAARWAALPGFVSRVAMAMRLTPTLEAGVAEARTHDDPLADRLEPNRGRPPDAQLADAFADLGPGADRVHGLLAAAPEASDPQRLLDRAVETALDATREHARTYTTSLQGPVTALYAFGVVLPLALVGVLPVAPLAGVSVPTPLLALLMDGGLPLGLLAATGWLVARRPHVHPPATIPKDDPTLGSTRRVAAAAIAGLVAGVLVSSLLADWARLVLPVAWAAGGGLLARFQPAVPAVEDATVVRRALPDLLASLGDAMTDGTPPEAALTVAAERPGPAGEVARDATALRSRLGVPVHDALTHEHGPLAVLPMRQRATVAALVATAGAAGTAGGRALTRYASHLDALHDLHRDLRADLAGITGTLTQTAALYAPAIGGVTVALATRLEDRATALQTVPEALPLVVAGYVLALAVVLPAMATLLVDGRCRVRVGTRVGRTLVLAGAAFPVAERVAGVLL